MSIKVLAWVLDHVATDDPIEQLVLCVLADHAWDDGTRSYPSVATICEQSRISKSPVQRALARLRGRGVVAVEGYVQVPTPGGRQRIPSYQVLMSDRFPLRKGVSQGHPLSTEQGVHDVHDPKGVSQGYPLPTKGVSQRPKGVSQRPKGVSQRPKGGVAATPNPSVPVLNRPNPSRAHAREEGSKDPTGRTPKPRPQTAGPTHILETPRGTPNGANGQGPEPPAPSPLKMRELWDEWRKLNDLKRSDLIEYARGDQFYMFGERYQHLWPVACRAAGKA